MAEQEEQKTTQQADPPAEAEKAPEPAAEEPQPEQAAPAEAEAEAAAPVAAKVPAPAPSKPAPPVPAGKHYFWGTGRRKQAVARVRIRPGTGQFLVNKRPAEDYFPQQQDRNSIVAPLQAAKMLRSWDVWANVKGGGYTGQAGAVMMGLARALLKAVPEADSALRDQNLLTRDARMVERKKPGQPGARKRFQFSKR